MINLHDAVRSAYSNAVIIYGNDVNSLEVLDANGQSITIVPSTVTSELATLQANATAAEQAAAAHKASAISKLTALGLSADEINALIGA
jgi:hypothetical protein